MSIITDWFDGYWWSHPTTGWMTIDPALYEWRYRWFELSNNPFGGWK